MTRPGRLASNTMRSASRVCLAHVVGHEQDGDTGGLPDPFELVVQNVTSHGVERAEGFVHQQDFRVLRECPRQRDPLAHATRQLVGAPIGGVDELHQLEQLIGPGAAPFAFLHAPQLERELDVAPSREPGKQCALLEHQRDLAVGDVDDASRRLVEAGDDVEQGGLAAARGPDETGELARSNVERETLERVHGLGAAAEDATQPGDVDRRAGGGQVDAVAGIGHRH